MADTVTQLVCRLKPFSGLSEDYIENVLHIGSTGSLSAGDLTDAMEAFRDFYNVDNVGQGNPIAHYLSGAVVRTTNACQILAYETTDLSGATPMGSPIDMLNFTLGASANTAAFPQEVAVVASYSADLTGVPITANNPTPPPATIRPAQRRRGRMYIGPLNVTASASTSTAPRPSVAFQTDIGYAFANMATTIGVDTAGYLGVWSKADEEVWQYAEGYADDAFDTQRRRGWAPTNRIPFPVI